MYITVIASRRWDVFETRCRAVQMSSEKNVLIHLTVEKYKSSKT